MIKESSKLAGLFIVIAVAVIPLAMLKDAYFPREEVIKDPEQIKVEIDVNWIILLNNDPETNGTKVYWINDVPFWGGYKSIQFINFGPNDDFLDKVILSKTEEVVVDFNDPAFKVDTGFLEGNVEVLWPDSPEWDSWPGRFKKICPKAIQIESFKT